jgi:hypothetical protein
MRLMLELLDQEEELSAIFAANNAIARGVIDALASRGLRIPQDIALVCFDDLPNTSHIFPFLTVVAQPAYDMGVNAAQMLLSRIESEGALRPRHVTLPLRLLVRHSCGSRLGDDGDCPLSLPVLDDAQTRSVMVKSLSPGELKSLAPWLEGISGWTARPDALQNEMRKPDVNRVLQSLRHEEADRLAHVELELTSRAIYEFVLEREVEYDSSAELVDTSAFAPEDQVDLAQRLGLDAVPCRFAWYPDSGDPTDLSPPPSLTQQLSYLERYLRAAQGSGVGVIACFSSFFGPALAAGSTGSGPLESLRRTVQPSEEHLMDALLESQERAVRVICDRFAADLAMVVIDDRIADDRGLLLSTEQLRSVYERRMRRLTAPASEHGLPLALRSDGRLSQALDMLSALGFRAIHPLGPVASEFAEAWDEWNERLTLMGGFPLPLLETGTPPEIEADVRGLCARMAPGGGFILGASGAITRAVPPENLLAMARAVQMHGRYNGMGQKAERVRGSTASAPELAADDRVAYRV